MNFDIQDATLFLTAHGSHSYGMATPSSDLDIDGICVAPLEYQIGFLNQFEQHQFKAFPFTLGDGTADSIPRYPRNTGPLLIKGQACEGTIYDIRKYFKLAADCNPNVIELLFTDDADMLYSTRLGDELRALGPLFLSTRAKHTFSGYAISQLKRINTHRQWLLHPPDHKPTREEFGLDPNKALMNSTDRGAIDALIEKHGEDYLRSQMPESVVEVYFRGQRYRNACKHWEQFENWKATRNEARAILEAAHGYDTKHAAHLVRLMRMCREILVEGVVRVRRPDAEELLEIRRGAWAYEQLIEFAEREDAELEAIYRAGTSPLPKQPDRAALDRHCRSIIMEKLYLSQY